MALCLFLPAHKQKFEAVSLLSVAIHSNAIRGFVASGAPAASLCGNSGEPSTSQPASAMGQAASQAASQGVFSTMMAASKVKPKPVVTSAASSAVTAVSAVSTCCRSKEEILLDTIFSSPAGSLARSTAFTQPCSHRLASGSSEAQAVSVSKSLWSCASCSEPPGCQLQERVQRRKANAAMEAERVKKQRIDVQQLQHASDVSLPSISIGVHDAAADHPNVQMLRRPTTLAGTADQDDCMLLSSPDAAVQAKPNDRCMLSQSLQAPAQAVQSSARTMDQMKSMRLQALEQELQAARQTVLDLERMIKSEELC